MPLKEYKEKRKFTVTPEPAGQEQKKSSSQPIFVVQKHDAFNLHYDLRLEADGVLKSWALPKGPTLDNSKKILAMMTEDHPIEYADFEGVIPPDNYGAGTVMVWDKGIYSHPEYSTKKEIETATIKGIGNGHITFILSGEKLKGEFALVRLKKSKEPNAWLLIKAKDQFESKEDVKKYDKSVKTGRSQEEIGAELSKKQSDELENLEVEDLPSFIKPMLATLIDKPFNDENWLFEVKWDGWRTIAKVQDREITLLSRNAKVLNDKFPDIVAELKKLKQTGLMVDGEIVVLNNEGKPDFQSLQNYSRGTGYLAYYIFDVLYFENKSLLNEPLSLRKEILKRLTAPLQGSPIKFSDHIVGEGEAFFDSIKKQGIEGMIAKKISSPYRPGERGSNWLKIKTHLQQEAIIIGYTEPEKGRTELGSLLLGVYQDEGIEYIGNVGTGFTEKTIRALKEKIVKLKNGDEKIINKHEIKNAILIKPKLVCEIKFQEWTGDNKIRQAVFLGLREDIEPKNVKREEPKRRENV